MFAFLLHFHHSCVKAAILHCGPPKEIHGSQAEILSSMFPVRSWKEKKQCRNCSGHHIAGSRWKCKSRTSVVQVHASQELAQSSCHTDENVLFNVNVFLFFIEMMWAFFFQSNPLLPSLPSPQSLPPPTSQTKWVTVYCSRITDKDYFKKPSQTNVSICITTLTMIHITGQSRLFTTPQAQTCPVIR